MKIRPTTVVGKLADPQFRHDRATKASRARTTPEHHLTKLVAKADEATDLEGLDQWAGQVAASLPALTSNEIAVIGKLAAALDARHREAGGRDG